MKIDDKVISAFIDHRKNKDVAAALHCSLSTVHRLRASPELQERLDERIKAITADNVRFMQGRLSGCIDELLEIIHDKDISPQIRINAIREFANLSDRWSENFDIMHRLEAVEKLTTQKEDESISWDSYPELTAFDTDQGGKYGN